MYELIWRKKAKLERKCFISFLAYFFSSHFFQKAKFCLHICHEKPATEGRAATSSQSSLFYSPSYTADVAVFKASGQPSHSDLSAKQQLLLSVVQSPLKIVEISALTPVTFGSNALKYHCYVPAGRHRRNTALCWKKERSHRFAFFFPPPFFKHIICPC